MWFQFTGQRPVDVQPVARRYDHRFRKQHLLNKFEQGKQTFPLCRVWFVCAAINVQAERLGVLHIDLLTTAIVLEG